VLLNSIRCTNTTMARSFFTTLLKCLRVVSASAKLPYYFEIRTHFSFFKHFPELKIRVHLKFEILLFTLQKSRKNIFPRRISGLAKRVVNFTDKPWTSTRVEKDARKLGCKNWLAAAQDRGRWRHLLEEARAHQGLQSRWWWWWWCIHFQTCYISRKL
jgi:hypothetical protein